MSQRRRLAGFIIDCQTDDLESAARFWSAALEMPISSEETGDAYVALDSGDADLHVEVQKVAHPSRVHLDVRASDVAAEVQRLERLGARQVQAFPRWVVMEAPTGQRFCVVRDPPDN